MTAPVRRPSTIHGQEIVLMHNTGVDSTGPFEVILADGEYLKEPWHRLIELEREDAARVLDEAEWSDEGRSCGVVFIASFLCLLTVGVAWAVRVGVIG